MILITGGLGFVGTHTARALLDLGETCLLVQRREPALPGGLEGRVAVACADVADAEALIAVARSHPVTGIVHLAGSVPWPPGAQPAIEAARIALGGLLNVFACAHELGVARVAVASTIGVYGGVPADGLLGEDVALPMIAPHPIPAFKKIGEMIGGYVDAATELEVINLRLSPWGPGANPRSSFSAVPQLVRAAALGTPPDFSAMQSAPCADDGLDMAYARDCGRAIALLALAPRLNHRTYNVAGGRVTTNQEVIDALADPRLSLPRREEPVPSVCLDIGRLREDTGYAPEYDTERAVADYVAWLRSGHDR
jgi:UDP-glucose 4-epimerase